MADDGRSAGNLELVGGRLCLDFANTVSSRSDGLGREYLTSYDDLLTWSVYAGVVGESKAANLRRWAAAHPEEARSVLQRGVALRETIYGLFAAVADGRDPQQELLSGLNAAVRDIYARLELSPSAEGFAWTWVRGEVEPEQMLWPVVRSAAELLTCTDLGRVRKCGREGCDWLFVDMSKNQSRRWCSMEVCGSRVKSQRYYYRKREEGT
jgi:predicted RNA-binding Zn ribbon-like protein